MALASWYGREGRVSAIAVLQEEVDALELTETPSQVHTWWTSTLSPSSTPLRWPVGPDVSLAATDASRHLVGRLIGGAGMIGRAGGSTRLVTGGWVLDVDEHALDLVEDALGGEPFSLLGRAPCPLGDPACASNAARQLLRVGLVDLA